MFLPLSIGPNRFRTILLPVVMMLLSASVSSAQHFPSTAEHFRYVFDIPGGYINDHCLIRAGDVWHLYFIQGKQAVGSWDAPGNEVIIGHATSNDLLSWQLHEPALHIGPPGSLDAGHIYAPSVFQFRGIYYMIYTGNPKSFNAGEHLLLATSKDLFNWRRHSPDPVIVPDTSWASYYPAGFSGGPGGPSSGRDPHIITDQTGPHRYICYYVAALRGDSSRPSDDREYSCIAAATSPDLINWTDHGPVLTRRTIGEDVYTWGHPESPCVIFRDNNYYLFWKSGLGTRYVISRNPLDFHDRTEYVLSTSHASEIFEWNDQWYITSCSRNIEDVLHSDDILHGGSDRTRGLFLASIIWDGRHPVVAPLPEKKSEVIER